MSYMIAFLIVQFIPHPIISHMPEDGDYKSKITQAVGVELISDKTDIIVDIRIVAP